MLRPFALSLCLAGPALADGPRVVADITPIHGLVSQVMAGVGAPDLLLQPGQSPHTYSMRPSEARRLQRADVVFWVGEELTPWMEKPLSSLADEARQVTLLDLAGLDLLEFEEHDDHDDEHHDDHDEGHADGHDEDHDEDHEGHGHDDHAENEDHHDEHDHDDDHHDEDHHDEGEEHADAHDHHHHEGIDPHAWLDPTIAVKWLGEIADTLSEVDPDNAAIYRANAERAQQTLTDLDQALAAQLAPVQGNAYVTFHDAYRYFERRYGLQNAGTVSDGDARDPGAARIAQIKAEIAERDVTCSFAEPQFDPSLLEVAAEDADVTIATLDPLGAHLEPGAQFYPALLQSLADGLIGCLVN